MTHYCPRCKEGMFKSDHSSWAGGRGGVYWNCPGCMLVTSDLVGPDSPRSQIAAGEEYWYEVFPTFLENWPKPLLDLHKNYIRIHLTSSEVPEVVSGIECHFKTGKTPRSYILDALRENLSVLIDRMFEGRAFVRLGFRSPKDSWIAQEHNLCATSGDMALDFLISSYERIHDDLLLCDRHRYLPRIWLFPYRDITEWSEFRVFVRDCRVVGISQYAYSMFFSEIANSAAEIEKEIRRFIKQEFVPVSHLDDVVVDVTVTNGRAELIEINPFWATTDPLLFRWGYDPVEERISDFDGSFRYVTEERKIDINSLFVAPRK